MLIDTHTHSAVRVCAQNARHYTFISNPIALNVVCVFVQGEERVDKKNVYNYELEGFEWDYAPSLLMYTREVRRQDFIMLCRVVVHHFYRTPHSIYHHHPPPTTKQIMLHVPALLNELFPDQLRISPRVSIAYIYVSTLYRAERLVSFPFECIIPLCSSTHASTQQTHRHQQKAYANKIAVSTGGGSHYLKHTDNNSPEAVRDRDPLYRPGFWS